MLGQYQAIINKTLKDCIRISLHEYDLGQTYSFSSKIAGTPYMPIGFEYPMDSKGNYLYLLAQINFGEIPELDGFPQDGILQFYISDDDLYGCDLADQTRQDGFRIIYFDKINEQNVTTDLSFLPDPKVPLPYSQSFLLNFNFEQYFYELENDHKIGGYPRFTQSDPRHYKHGDKEILLLQIDTDDAHNIVWGDQGVGNFFISKADLEQKNFSNVLYNWDCY